MRTLVKLEVSVTGEILVPGEDVEDVKHLNPAGAARMLETRGMNLEKTVEVVAKRKGTKPVPEATPAEAPEGE